MCAFRRRSIQMKQRKTSERDSIAGSGLGCITGLLIKVSAGEEELPTMPAGTRAEGCEGVLLRAMASAPPLSKPRVVKVGSSTGGEHGLDEDIAVLRVGSADDEDKTLFNERLISCAVEDKLELAWPPRSLEGSRLSDIPHL